MPPRYQMARQFKRVTKAGSASYASSTWAALDTSLDITLAAAIGDCFRHEINLRKDGSPTFQLDVVTVYNTVVTNSQWSGAAAPTSTTDAGVRGWVATIDGDDVSGSLIGAPLVAGDIYQGYVTFRLWYRASGSITIGPGSSGMAIVYSAQNLGPVDPN